MQNEATLSEAAANMVENAGMRVAERHGGRITAVHLAPYLPMSLGLIQSCLDDSVDNASVFRDDQEHVTVYEFAAYRGKESGRAALNATNCLSCDAPLAPRAPDAFCGVCRQALRKELTRLADATGWPAEAVYEHEILRIASRFDGPVRAEDLASRSRYTMKNMRRKLGKMSLAGFIRKEFDETTGMVVYHVPAIKYSAEQFRTNMAVIRGYPAAAMEDIQLRVAHVLGALGVLLIVLLVLALLHFPYPLLALGFVITAPVLSLIIWRRRGPAEPD